jgi:mannose-6-phosphate isomerase-like protein (cupin superfamily)
VDLETGQFEVELRAFEDVGARWVIPFEDASNFKFARDAVRVDAAPLAAAVEHFDKPLEIECDPRAKARTEQRIRELTALGANQLRTDLRSFGPRTSALGSRRSGPGVRRATTALELEVSYQRVPPGYRFPYGHRHETQEEVYVALRRSGRMKVDDELVELNEWDAVRVPRGMWRGYEAGPEGLEILVVGAPNLGEDPREEVEGQRDWWAD